MKLHPLFFLASRYLRRRRRVRGVGAPLLSVIGLAVGVMALNGVLAVMNGFQLTFIDSLVEVSSSHIQWHPTSPPSPDELAKARSTSGVRSVVATSEGQTLLSSPRGERRAAVIRAWEADALEKDPSLAAHLDLSLPGGQNLHLPNPGQVYLGVELCRALGVSLGDTIGLTSLTGPSFSLLSPQVENLTVAGLFSTGYYEMDAGLVIVNLDDARRDLTNASDEFWAIKLADSNTDVRTGLRLAHELDRPESEFRSWRQFNRGFFGALRTEKTIMMILVGLIFAVVGVNIYFSQKRAVSEHREDLALWSAVGVVPRGLRNVFALEGLVVGVLAAALGTLLGLGVAWSFGTWNWMSSEAFYLPSLPARVVPTEVLWIALSCIGASTFAAWLASAGVTRVSVAEVLKSS